MCACACALDTHKHAQTRAPRHTRFPKFSDALVVFTTALSGAYPCSGTARPPPPPTPPPTPPPPALHTLTHSRHRHQYDGGLVKDWNSQSQMVRSLRLGGKAVEEAVGAVDALCVVLIHVFFPNWGFKRGEM